VVRKDGLTAGFVDWLDILGYLIDVVSESKHSRVTPASRSLTTDDFSMILERANEFSLRTVGGKHLSNKSSKDPWKSVKAGDSLQKAVNVLANYHHVAVEKQGKLVNICSQMDLLRWLHSDSQRMGAVGRKTLQGLKLHR
jgi:CBS-domain-containing membrane protein